MRITSTLVALGFVFTVGACGGGNDGEKFGAIADEVCACKSEECVKKAEQKWEKLEEEMEAKYKGKEPDDSVKKAYRAAENKAEKCMEELEDNLKK